VDMPSSSELRIWAVVSKRQLASFSIAPERISSVALSENGLRLLAADFEHNLYLWCLPGVRESIAFASEVGQGSNAQVEASEPPVPPHVERETAAAPEVDLPEPATEWRFFTEGEVLKWLEGEVGVSVGSVLESLRIFSTLNADFTPS